MVIYRMARTDSVRDIGFVGRNTACAEALERAGLRTIGDLMDTPLDDVSENGPLKRIWGAVDCMQNDQTLKKIKHWDKICLAAYHAILLAQKSAADEEFDVPQLLSLSHIPYLDD